MHHVVKHLRLQRLQEPLEPLEPHLESLIWLQSSSPLWEALWEKLWGSPSLILRMLGFQSLSQGMVTSTMLLFTPFVLVLEFRPLFSLWPSLFLVGKSSNIIYASIYVTYVIFLSVYSVYTSPSISFIHFLCLSLSFFSLYCFSISVVCFHGKKHQNQFCFLSNLILVKIGMFGYWWLVNWICLQSSI